MWPGWEGVGRRHNRRVGIAFAVQGDPAGRQDWLALARRADELGFDALSIADHPGTTASPFVMLAVAAQVTTRLRLVSAVATLVCGNRSPWLLRWRHSTWSLTVALCLGSALAILHLNGLRSGAPTRLQASVLLISKPLSSPSVAYWRANESP